MAIKTISPSQVNFKPESLRDAAYQGAHAGDTLASCARYLRDVQPDILDKGITTENKAQLVEGWQVKYNEMHSGDTYMIIEEKYIPVEAGKKAPDNVPTALFTVGVAMSMTSQEFGKLKSIDAGKHSIIGKWRERFSKFCSDQLNGMLAILKKDEAEALRIANGGQPRTRATLDFVETLEKHLEELSKQRKNKAARGDTTTPDEVKWKAACEGFKKALG